MLNYDFEESIGFWLNRAWVAYERAINVELVPRGITFRQAQVLGFLALEKQLSQIDLADRMRIEPPTLVGILDRMERDGWIVRQDCPTDRRKKMISATAQADPVWSEVVECAMRVRAAAIEGLSTAQVKQFMALLGQMEKNLTTSRFEKAIVT